VKIAIGQLVLAIVISKGWIDFATTGCQEHVSTWCSVRGGLYKNPPGFENKQRPNYVCKLDKTLYGLK
jgi:hypothetical protein